MAEDKEQPKQQREFSFNDGNIKRLPRDESGQLKPVFKANGNYYKITHWPNGVPIKRWHLYELFSLSFSYNRDPVEIYNHNAKAEAMLRDILRQKGGVDAIDVIQHLKASQDGILELNPNRFNRALYVCSLFIIGENEDVKTWSQEIAEQKINDWVTEGLAIDDFFILARTTAETILPGLKKYTAHGLAEAQKRNAAKTKK